MSLKEFCMSVRAGASSVLPSGTVDSPNLDAGRFEALLRGADLWLTPLSVEGYEESDFGFLPADERQSLTESVARFLDVAKHVPPKEPATDDQVENAYPVFQSVLKIIRPDKYGDVQALVIGKRLEQRLEGQLPDWVNELKFETGDDANGDPAIWIWVEIADAAADAEVFSQNTKQVREIVVTAFRKLGDQHWPYVRFRTSSEQASEQAAGQARDAE